MKLYHIYFVLFWKKVVGCFQVCKIGAKSLFLEDVDNFQVSEACTYMGMCTAHTQMCFPFCM